MKPGFLTDSSPVEFLNQVDNNRDQKKGLRKNFMFGVYILEFAYVSKDGKNHGIDTCLTLILKVMMRIKIVLQ